jgi:putative transposase
VVDYVRPGNERAEVPAKQILRWMNVPEGTFYSWRQRYGKVNEHNRWIPRDHWLSEWEKQAIIQFHFDHPLEGYRRLTYMMLDADIVAAAPSTVYRVLKLADLIGRRKGKPRRKEPDFISPVRPMSTGISTCPTSTSPGRSIT